MKKKKDPSYTHHIEEIKKTLDLIVDDARSPQVVVDIVDLFFLVEPLIVHLAFVGYQITFVEPPEVVESQKISHVEKMFV